jgi:hypothetical protein
MNTFEIIKKLKEGNRYQLEYYSLGILFRRLSIYLTPLFIYLKCSANVTTLIALVVGLSAGMLLIIYGYSVYFYSVLLYFLHILIDHCDGNIARLNNTPSFFGRFIDGLFDTLVIGFLQIAMFYILLNDKIFIDSNIFNYLEYDLVIIIIITSIFLTPIQHLIYDRYSAYIRWINFEHESKLSPTLKNEISLKIINLLDDHNFGFILIILGMFSINFIILYFTINLISSVYLILLHTFFSRKHMTIFASDYRKPKK